MCFSKEPTLVRSTTRFCSRLTSASWCSRFFFSSKSWLWTHRISSCSCCRAFSSILALRKNRQTCELLRAALNHHRDQEGLRGEARPGLCHPHLTAVQWKWGSCSLIGAVVRKRYERRTTPGQPSCAAQDNYWNLTCMNHLNNCTSVLKSICLPLRTCLAFNKHYTILGSTGSFFPNKVGGKVGLLLSALTDSTLTVLSK